MCFGVLKMIARIQCILQITTVTNIYIEIMNTYSDVYVKLLPSVNVGCLINTEPQVVYMYITETCTHKAISKHFGVLKNKLANKVIILIMLLCICNAFILYRSINIHYLSHIYTKTHYVCLIKINNPGVKKLRDQSTIFM